MEYILEKLFESTPKIRIMRIFLRNPDVFYTFEEVCKKTQVKPTLAKRELVKLLKVGLISKRLAIISKEIKHILRGRPEVLTRRRKSRVYYANQHFPLFSELRDLIAKSSITSKLKLFKKIRSLGNVKLAITSGVFNGHTQARTDLLIVGDNIKKGKLDNLLNNIESDLGKQVQYTLMDTEEFKYRTKMYDRFLRDILEFPHEKLVNRLNV